jgi:hypothetical protein
VEIAMLQRKAIEGSEYRLPRNARDIGRVAAAAPIVVSVYFKDREKRSDRTKRADLAAHFACLGNGS